MENFANGFFKIDDMGADNRKLAVDLLYSKGRQHGLIAITAAHTVTDLNPKAKDSSSNSYITLKSVNPFSERVEETFSISEANLSRYKHYEFRISMYNMKNNYYPKLDKNQNIDSDSTVDDNDIDECIDIIEFTEPEFECFGPSLLEKLIETVTFKKEDQMFWSWRIYRI